MGSDSSNIKYEFCRCIKTKTREGFIKRTCLKNRAKNLIRGLCNYFYVIFRKFEFLHDAFFGKLRNCEYQVGLFGCYPNLKIPKKLMFFIRKNQLRVLLCNYIMYCNNLLCLTENWKVCIYGRIKNISFFGIL